MNGLLPLVSTDLTSAPAFFWPFIHASVGFLLGLIFAWACSPQSVPPVLPQQFPVGSGRGPPAVPPTYGPVAVPPQSPAQAGALAPTQDVRDSEDFTVVGPVVRRATFRLQSGQQESFVLMPEGLYQQTYGELDSSRAQHAADRVAGLGVLTTVARTGVMALAPGTSVTITVGHQFLGDRSAVLLGTLPGPTPS